MIAWLILTATLPTTPSGLRVRVWRALKATHCATLREGVYILPATASGCASFRSLDATIREAGADSHLLEVTARDEAQEAAFRALFDRTEHYAEFSQTLAQAKATLADASEAQARRLLRTLDQQLQALLASDFFADSAARRAREACSALRSEVERRFSPNEPGPVEGEVPPCDPTAFVGRCWATRARPWVDRLASAWLILRFLDPQARFIWLTDAAGCPAEAIGFDFDGARFSHVGEWVTFEVLAASFGLNTHPGVRQLGELVHVLDVGGVPREAAPGLELMVRGLQALHADDDALLVAALPLFDTVQAGLAAADFPSSPST